MIYNLLVREARLSAAYNRSFLRGQIRIFRPASILELGPGRDPLLGEVGDRIAVDFP